MKKAPWLFISALIFIISCKTSQNPVSGLAGIDPFNFEVQKEATGKNGAVVSAHPLASKVGLQILKNGGNAFDAAIATQWALAVVFPNAGNIGGGGFLVAHKAGASSIALDYREKAPGEAHRDMYLDKNGKAQTELSQYTQLSSGVPGTVAGLFATLPYAKLSMEKLIEPAIALAEFGFVLTEREANGLNNLQDDLVKYNSVTPVFVKKEGWKKGDTLVQKDLAATLKRIRAHGQKGFYEGETAELIVAEMKRGNGIISMNDLKNYDAKVRTPHVFDYKGYQVVSMPMPSSGGVLLNQMLKMVEDKPLPAYGFNSLKAVQLMTEVERRAFADRAEYMGDADFYNVPVKKMVDAAYLKERMKDFDPAKAGNSEVIKPGIIAAESEETTHLSVMDKEGNAVAVTTTLNNSFGSRIVVGDAGFFLNDEMDDFSIKPGVPNMFGAVGGEANAIVAGKRMLSSMTPTILLKNNYPFLVVGTPGGTTIPTSVFQTIVNIVDFGMSSSDAVNKPKFHHQWLPDEIMVERNFPQNIIDSLESMGYKISKRGAIGRTDIIKVRPDKTLEAVGDKRGDDSAEAY